MQEASDRKKGFWSAFTVYQEPEAVRMLFLGFSSGLPLLLVFGTLSFWLRESGVDLKTIGFMSWVGLCWGFKWVWAPLVDRLPIPLLTQALGRRRSWLLLSQIGLVCTLCGMAFTDPAQHLRQMALCALGTAFFGATQDIALDAFRIESGEESKQAAYAATYQMGYRIAMIWSGAGALAIAAGAEAAGWPAWKIAYGTMAASMVVGIVAVLLSPEPARSVRPAPFAGIKSWFFDAAVRPFVEFFSRFGWWALAVLALIATYRVSDIVMGVMANPFYQDLGFTKEEVAAVTKVFGVIMTLVGAFVGGVVTAKIGVMKTLFLGGFLSAGTNLLFSALASVGHDLTFLIFTVSADNLAGGLASAAFVAYLSGLTNSAYSATQYALFSSVMLLLPKFLAGFSGMAVESVGFGNFFAGTACLGVPVLVLVVIAGIAKKKMLQKAEGKAAG